MAALMIPPAYALSDDPSPECDIVGDMPKDPIIEKEIFHVAGDAPDPTRETNLRGLQPGFELSKSAAGRPLVHYAMPGGAEMLLEIDVYQFPGEPMYLSVICPHCILRDHGSKRQLTVRSQVKQMAYDPLGIPPTFPGWTDKQMVSSLPQGAGGLLSCERFKCTWEVDPRYRERMGNICDFEVVIDRNVARRVTHTAASLIRSPTG
jgi:hypothetical protein